MIYQYYNTEKFMPVDCPVSAVTLASLGGEFLGFVVQAREQDTTTVIGSFTILDSDNSQRLNCDSAEGTVNITSACSHLLLITVIMLCYR